MAQALDLINYPLEQSGGDFCFRLKDKLIFPFITKKFEIGIDSIDFWNVWSDWVILYSGRYKKLILTDLENKYEFDIPETIYNLVNVGNKVFLISDFFVYFLDIESQELNRVYIGFNDAQLNIKYVKQISPFSYAWVTIDPTTVYLLSLTEMADMTIPFHLNLQKQLDGFLNGTVCYRVEAKVGDNYIKITEVQCEEFNYESVQLTWDEVPEADFYRVWKGHNPLSLNNYMDVEETSLFDDGETAWEYGYNVRPEMMTKTAECIYNILTPSYATVNFPTKNLKLVNFKDSLFLYGDDGTVEFKIQAGDFVYLQTVGYYPFYTLPIDAIKGLGVGDSKFLQEINGIHVFENLMGQRFYIFKDIVYFGEKSYLLSPDYVFDITTKSVYKISLTEVDEFLEDKQGNYKVRLNLYNGMLRKLRYNVEWTNVDNFYLDVVSNYLGKMMEREYKLDVNRVDYNFALRGDYMLLAITTDSALCFNALGVLAE